MNDEEWDEQLLILPEGCALPTPAVLPPVDPRAIWRAENAIKLEAQRQLLAQQGIKETWDTDQLEHDFKVESFTYGICFVTRKSDGVQGSLDFTHSPRLYFGFVPR